MYRYRGMGAANVSFQTPIGPYAGAILQLYPGDNWTMAITGAQPNARVAVSGSMPGSIFNDVIRGTTDAAGNFSLSGAITADEVGEWREMWTVGGVPAGGFGFVVNSGSRAVPPVMPPAVPPANVALPPASLQNPKGGFTISSIPMWGWAAGVLGVLLLFGGGRGR